MSETNRNRHSNNVGFGSQEFSDDSADFLDSLMEDVMGTNETTQESVFTQPTFENENSHNNQDFADDNTDTSDNEYTHGNVDNNEEPVSEVKPRRKMGLLNRFNSGASTEVSTEVNNVDDDNSGELQDKKSNVSEDRKGEAPKESQESEPASGSRKRGILPLLSRVSSAKSGDDNSQETKEHTNNNSNKDKVEDVWGNKNEDIWENQEKNEPPIDVTNQKDDIPNEDNISSQDDKVDLFDEMLEDLEEGDNIEQARKNAQLDPEVEVPLEKPGMDEVVVTADGRTLADMLPGLRGGNKSIKKVVSDIRNQENVIEVQGKKFADNRYTKHVEAIDKEVAEQEKRVALSMKFLQRNAEFTEQEKIIMKNLGLTNNQLAQVMKSKELSIKEKNRLLGLGRYGAERHFKGRRYRTTVGDTAMLEYLVKFKFANTRILRWISNEPQNRTWRKLNRLRNSGLVESKSIIGIPDLWGATPAGTAIAGYSLAPGLRPMPKIPTISSSMGINYIAACLWFNTVNVLNLEDFPAENRVISLQEDGRDRVRGEMLVSELEIRSSLGKEINPSSTTMQTLGDERLYDVISSNVRLAFEEWEDGGMLGDSPEFMLGNEYMWVLYPTSQLTLSYHVPDLVVRRERGPNGEPRSIAIEMERYEKTNDRYDKIMLAYKLDKHLYEEVVWITPNTRVARMLEQAAESVGFDRYRIIPIITENGIYDKQDIWLI